MLLILIYLILVMEIYRLSEDGILKMQKYWFCYKHKFQYNCMNILFALKFLKGLAIYVVWYSLAY